MSLNDLYIAEKTMQNRVEENVKKAEAHRLVRELEAGRPSWWFRLACKVGQWAARRLIAAGEKLEQAALRTLRPAGT